MIGLFYCYHLNQQYSLTPYLEIRILLVKIKTMAVYYIGSYDIHNMEEFMKYPQKVMELLPKYGGKVLASDVNAIVLEGTAKTMNAIIEFPSEEAVLAMYNDPDYEQIKKLRQNTTSNTSMVVVKGFEQEG
jgi:uncharacterized protein (DUF1330 family)